MSDLYTVIGNPIAHSKSPLMHNAAFKALRIDAVYSATKVTDDELQSFTEKAKEELKGFNVTVPHKNTVMQFLDEISKESIAAGSVNTVTVKDGRLIGDTTDGYGLQSALKEAFDVDVKGGRFLFLGAGGTVKAVTARFLSQGAEGIYIMNRTVSKAEDIADNLKKYFPGKDIRFGSIEDHSLLAELMEDVEVVIQATSLGLKESDPSPISADLMNPNVCMFDTIYKKTPFLKNAEKTGCRYAGGIGMLLHQGARSFEIWTGKKPDIEIMRKALS